VLDAFTFIMGRSWADVMTAESVEVPWTIVNGVKGLTGLQLVEHPHLMRFVRRFPQYFYVDPNRDVYWYIPSLDVAMAAEFDPIKKAADPEGSAA
jgi:hypothetical protein